MRTHLEFKSIRFEGGPNSYNPEIHGARLAAFLDERFKSAGYSGGIIEEDWGWMVNLSNDPFPLWLGCAGYESPDGWLVFIEPSKPFVRKWLRKIDAQPAVERVAVQLEKVLTEHGDATGLRWWSDEDSGRK
jgi:hypothetical protein